MLRTKVSLIQTISYIVALMLQIQGFFTELSRKKAAGFDLDQLEAQIRPEVRTH